MAQDTISHIARILRADHDTVFEIEKKMSKRFGKIGVFAQLMEENNKRMDQVISKLGVKKKRAADIYNALIGKIEEDDKNLREGFLHLQKDGKLDWGKVADIAFKLSKAGSGFFMKMEKAEEMLRKNPPQNIMKFFGYKSLDELLKNQDSRKVFAALRFAEEKEWLNNVFFGPYKDLTPDDFEWRQIEVLVLENHWMKMAEKFLKKKYHNVSHLKELGLIFILPQTLGIAGETLRLFSLILHYLHEVVFYSFLFQRYTELAHDPLNPEGFFAEHFVSGLRGDILDARLPDHQAINWMIVQRYLAKDDEYDWRLFEPHVNPEAFHWSRAEETISHINEHIPGLDLGFWHNLDWVGNYFPTSTSGDALISFNLIDNVMSLVMKKEMVKYLYHHQEALWNKIFESYMGEDEMRSLVIKNFYKGYITL